MITTKKHFQYFCERVDFWQKEFGLGEWKIYVVHRKLDERMGQTDYKIGSRKATI